MISREAQTNHCGTCTMCCKLLGIPELEKPVGAWCQHCQVGKGCRAYEARPADCHTYVCLWLQCRQEGHPVSDDLRPDRCGVIVDADLSGTTHHVRVEPSKADAWRKARVQAFIAPLFEIGPVGLVCGDTRRWMRAAPK